MSSYGTSVSLGKFPFEYTEQQVLEIAKRIGPVVSVRLLFDDLTGKSKGYAIVTYEDTETAASAVRNLDYLNIPNGRFLRCSFAQNGADTIPPPPGRERLPPLPQGLQIHNNQPPSQVISNLLANLDTKRGFGILAEMKGMAVSEPKLAVELLAQYPQLAHALVELSLLSNTSNRDLILLALNKKQSSLREVTADHAHLLKDIANLPEDDINALDEDKQKIMHEIRQEIKRGTYGDIAASS